MEIKSGLIYVTMVFRRRVKARKAKRVPRRRRAARKSVYAGESFMPRFRTMKLKYLERTEITSIAGVVSNYLWRGNSVYDPDYQAALGISAMGHGTMSVLYERYRVIAAKCRTRVIVNSSTSEWSYEAALIPVNNGFGTTATPEQVRMNRGGKFVLVGNEAGSSGIANLRTQSTSAHVQGRTPQAILSEDNQGALVAANPADPWYFLLALQPADHSATMAWTVYQEIIYTVRYEDCRPFNT